MTDIVTLLRQGPARFRIAVYGVSLLLFLLFVGICLAVSTGYLVIGLGQQFLTLVISALGALSTVLLVAVTLVTFVENRLVEYAEQQRPLVKEELEKFLIPAVQELEENVERVKQGGVDFSKTQLGEYQADHPLGREPLNSILKHDTYDEIIYSRCLERHPELRERIETHDIMLNKLVRKAREVAEELEDPVIEYMEEEGSQSINLRAGNPEKISWILVANPEELTAGHDYKEMWEDHREGLNQAAASSSANFNSFETMKQDYIVITEEIITKLEQTRGESQRTYHVSV